jgi:hypothetical protein
VEFVRWLKERSPVRHVTEGNPLRLGPGGPVAPLRIIGSENRRSRDGGALGGHVLRSPRNRRTTLSDIEKAAADFLGRDPEIMEVALYLDHLIVLRDQLGDAIDAVRARFKMLLDEAEISVR